MLLSVKWIIFIGMSSPMGKNPKDGLETALSQLEKSMTPFPQAVLKSADGSWPQFIILEVMPCFEQTLRITSEKRFSMSLSNSKKGMFLKSLNEEIFGKCSFE